MGMNSEEKTSKRDNRRLKEKKENTEWTENKR